jgi:hypothetical protein
MARGCLLPPLAFDTQGSPWEVLRY